MNRVPVTTHILGRLRHARRLLALVVLALGLVHGALAAHFLLVDHERCPEHGDWMHVHAGAPHHPQSLGPLLAGPDADTPDDHDHCAAPTVLGQRLVEPAATRQPSPLTALLDAPRQSRAPPVAVVVSAPLRLAPKTSPPA